MLTWKYCICQGLRTQRQTKCWKKEMASASSNLAEYVCWSKRKKKQPTNWGTVNHKLTVLQYWHPWSCTKQLEADKLYSLRTCVKWLFCCESESSRCTVMAWLGSVEFHPEEPLCRIELPLSAARSQPLPTPCEWCDMADVLRSNNGLCLHCRCFLWETEAHPRPHVCFNSRMPSQNWTFKLTGREKRHKSVKAEEAYWRRRFPAAPRHVPWNEGLYHEWWRREGERKSVGFRERTRLAERRDQSVIVTENLDLSSTPCSIPRNSHCFNVVLQLDSVTLHLPFVTAARYLEVRFVIIFLSSGLKMGQTQPPSRHSRKRCTQIESGVSDLQR